MTNHHKPIVVGIDGSAQALRATRWAAHEAALRHRNLLLVNIYTCRVSGYSDAAVIAHELREAVVLHAARCLDDARLTAAETAPGITVTKQVLEGDPQPTLRALSRGAELMVVGARGLGGFAGLLIGSTATGLAAHADCPVVVVREDHARQTGPIVVGVDRTPLSEPAIAFAFEEASLRGAPLVVVHAWHDSAFATAPRPSVPAQPLATAADQAEELIAEQLVVLRDKYPDVRVHTEVRGIRAADALTRLSKTAQLVVVGSRGHGALVGLALGSTSQAVVRHAAAPVVVVRAGTR